MPICITGMHRSGTSLMGKLLHRCGLWLGRDEDLIPPSPDNPDGHWEHRRFVQLSDKILNVLGGGWDCPPRQPEPFDAPQLLPLGDEAARLSEEFAGREPWGWKDPRVCLAWPFWNSVFTDLRLIVCLRHPLEVAVSLRRRGLSSYSFGLQLWKIYNERILAASRPEQRLITHYDRYVDPSLEEIRRVAGFAGLPIDDSALAACSNGVIPSLRHSRFGAADLVAMEVSPDIIELYHQMLEEACCPVEPGTPVRKSRPAPASAAPEDSKALHPAAGTPGAAPPAVRRADDAAAVNDDAVDLELLRRERLDLHEKLRDRDAAIRELHERVEAAAKELRNLTGDLAAKEHDTAGLRMELDRLQRHCETLSGQLSGRAARDEELLGAVRGTAESLGVLRDESVSRAVDCAARDERLLAIAGGLAGSLDALRGTAAAQQAVAAVAESLETLRAAAASGQAVEAIAESVEKQSGQFVLLGTAVEESRRQASDRLRDLERAVRELRKDALARHQEQEQTIRGLRGELFARQTDLRNVVQRMHEQAAAQQDDLHAVAYELMASQAVALLHGETASQRLAYEQLLQQIRAEVRECVPRDAVVVVVSRGDNNLLKLFGRKAWHFPQNMHGVYAGFYPANSLAAVAHLESLRARGATHLLIPDTSAWWLETYPGFREHLERRYCLLRRAEGLLSVYSLDEAPERDEDRPRRRFEEIVAAFRYMHRRDPAILDWNSGLDLKRALPRLTVFSPPVQEATLPYFDQSIDLVVVPDGIPSMLAEARRVVDGAVIRVGGSPSVAECPIEVAWRKESIAANRMKTSIIIPAFNGLELTKACVNTLRETLPADFDVEIIVIDDASTDDTLNWLQAMAAMDSRIRVIHNETNAGFLGSVNRAAAAAQGEILVFLNNDTVLLPGWFPPLVQTFREYPNAGAVGGRLLFPDGRIQEVGGMVFRDGSAAHFGRDDYQLDADEYNVLREADYCSGALLATPRKLFHDLGGFDPAYGFGYYEDTDYCFRVRERGCSVYCQPKSTIVHLEGATAGTDLSRGAKHYQVVNQARFVARWQDVLAHQPTRPSATDRLAWETAAFTRQGGKSIRR